MFMLKDIIVYVINKLIDYVSRKNYDAFIQNRVLGEIRPPRVS